MSSSAMIRCTTLASTVCQTGRPRSAVRGRACVRASVSGDVASVSSTGSSRRNLLLLGSLAASITLPAIAATEAKPMSPVNAFITLMDGRDALVSAMELQGTEGGKRERVKNLLPRYADKAKTMTAALPAAVVAAYGEVVTDDTAGSLETDGVPPSKMGVMEDILVGAKNLVTLAAFVSEDRPFEDGDIPQTTFAAAVRAVDVRIFFIPKSHHCLPIQD